VVDSLEHLIGEQIPDDHARQYRSQDYLRDAMTSSPGPPMMVDLGCGKGGSAQFARRYKPEVRWIGVDIMQSGYARHVGDEQVVLYDGVNLPFADDTIPLIYSNQVFEHVRHPELLLREIRRVLQLGGVFIGSTSQLEPYHSWSLWNYTIYGFKVLVEDAGLTLEQVRPGIDGISLVQRQWFGRRPEHSAWFALSPLNAQIDQEDQARRRSVKDTNSRKLQYCGQFAFRVRKPGGEPLSMANDAGPSAPPGPVGRELPAVPVAAPAIPAPARVEPMQPLGASPTPPSLTVLLRRKAARLVRRARRLARRSLPGGPNRGRQNRAH
jgi:SAM-dependent methyltransferase